VDLSISPIGWFFCRYLVTDLLVQLSRLLFGYVPADIRIGGLC
jgi:hypothetical protein